MIKNSAKIFSTIESQKYNPIRLRRLTQKVPSGIDLLSDPFSNIPTKVFIKGSKPAARDGHTCNLIEVNNGKKYMVIFGGDRFKMSFSDFFMLDITAELAQNSDLLAK